MGSIYLWKYNFEDHQLKSKKESSNYKNRHTSVASSTVEIDLLSTLINRQTCRSVLKDGHFLNAIITDNGTPVVFISRNRSFFFSIKTQCWHLVPALGSLSGDDSQLVLNSNSVFAKTRNSNNLAGQMGPLSIIQSRDKNTKYFLYYSALKFCI
jgi:hypothetical protein